MEVIFNVTDVYKRLVSNWDKRYLIFKGGSSSSKTISILQGLTIYALQTPNSVITLSAESLPVVKKTLLVDWKKIVMQDLYQDNRFNKTEMVYTFPNKSIFQFVPADDEHRWHGMRQDITYFDEINHIRKAVYDQADIRTKVKVISSFNPTNMFWLADSFEDVNTYVDHSTYHDNPFITQSIIDALEKRISTDSNFYKVYVLGEWGSLEGLVYEEGTNWSIVDSLPDSYDKRVLAVDFGYSNDPASILDIRYFRGELFVDEVAYRTGMLNSDIHRELMQVDPNLKAIADSAEPKSIDEIFRLGYDINPSVKGRDSINSGISLVKEYKVNVTSRSINTIKELRKYNWSKDKNGSLLSKPIDNFNHSLDALRYGVVDMMNVKTEFTLV